MGTISPRPLFRHAFLAAVVLTVLNAAKPAVIDDTAYLHFARHISQKPLDPYGWELFWYSAPQPAMEILMPPVVPYWLAAGIALFGEERLFVLKLWLFPFAWLLFASVASLMHRFGAGGERPWFLVFACSPAVLPLFCAMLDIPALALGSAAVATFVHGCDRRRFSLCALAGLLTGLAMQTKYSMLVVPGVLVLYAALVGRNGFGVLGIGVAGLSALAVFGGWELFLLRTCGESHFYHHFTSASGEEGGLGRKFAFAKPLMIQFGGLACGLSLVCSRAAGWPLAVRIAAALSIVALAGTLSLLPARETVLFGKLDLSYYGFYVLGGSVVVTIALLAGRAIYANGLRRDTAFLLAWLAFEVLGMLSMTPFPAARRLVGVHLAFAIIAVHASATLRIAPERWAIAVAVAFGLFVSAVDCWDAYPEKALVERAAAVATPAPGETVWYTGHWGFQYYAERCGMKPIVPGRTVFRTGDWLVVPDLPKDDEFYRPNPPDPDWPKPWMRVQKIADWTWEDGLRAQTLPNLYGGAIPLTNRDHPRLKVILYRIIE